MYKDRLLRFGFELVEYMASLYNCEIEIIDYTEKSEQQELVEDLVQIITVFSNKKCRIYAVCGVSQTPKEQINIERRNTFLSLFNSV